MLPCHRNQGVCFPLGSWSQLYLHWLIQHTGKHWSWRGLKCKARRGRRGWVFRWRGPRNLKWNWWSQSVGQIYHPFYQCSQAVSEEKWKLFGCGSPDHLIRDCLKDLSKTVQKVSLNVKEGMAEKGGQASQKPVVTQPVSQMRLLRPENISKGSLLEPQST